MVPKIIIYSSICGGVDKRNDDIRVFSEYDRFNENRLNAKIYKIMPHLFMDVEWSIFVDGNLDLKVKPEELVAMMEKDIMVFKHPHRNCLYKEAEECKMLGLDKEEIIDEQIGRYLDEGYPEDNGLGACYLIVRKHTPEINRLNERWWAEICRGSKRDQISFPYVFRDVHYLKNPPINPCFTRRGHLIKTR